LLELAKEAGVRPAGAAPREREAFGVLYERYALGRLFGSLTRKLGLREVVELPALGAKAMPSLYSHGFAVAGCQLTLVNGVEASMGLWRKLGLAARVRAVQVPDLHATPLPSGGFDLAWNFATFPTAEDPDALLREMGRLSRRYVLAVSVNRGNVGFPVHRMAHRLSGVPWTHGDIRFNSPALFRRFLRDRGFAVTRWGFVDCPPWPDSLGFRDLRLHRLNVDLNAIDWDSDYFEYGRGLELPPWIRLAWLCERLPLPRFLKSPYAHLFFVLAEKREPRRSG